MVWNKGPTAKLPPGVTRYEIRYRVHDGDKWNTHRMWKTDKVGKEKEIGEELYRRLTRRPNPVDIMSIKAIEGEIPLETGTPSMVVTPKEYEEMRAAEAASVSKKDLVDRAKEHGWDRIAEDIKKGGLN